MRADGGRGEDFRVKIIPFKRTKLRGCNSIQIEGGWAMRCPARGQAVARAREEYRAMDSPIKWMGGKKKLSKAIVQMLPMDAEFYGEVFAGAAWVLFNKPPHPVEAINDKNDHLVNLWRVMKWRNAELLEVVHQSLYSRTLFYELREADPSQMTELERAAWLYLLIQQSFGSDLSSIRSSRFGYRKAPSGSMFLDMSLKQFEPAKERLQKVFVENCDFEDFMRRYDHPRSLFFCDPPYLGTCGYGEGFTADDHERLTRTLQGIQGRFLLTVNDSPETRELYALSQWRVMEAREPRGISRQTQGRQAAPILIVTNYASPQRDLFDFDEEEEDEDDLASVA